MKIPKTITVEIAVGTESAAVVTLLSRATTLARNGKMGEGWTEYAHIGDAFIKKVNTAIDDAVKAEQLRCVAEIKKKRNIS